MKTPFLKIIGKIIVMTMITIISTACDDDEKNTFPGSWIEREIIQTFPGDTVLITGTASNYIGLATITLNSEKWEINKIYHLADQKPTVFNYTYQLAVPETATFNETLTVTVRDVNGLETIKNITMEFIPDTQAPVLQTALPEQVGVDYDPTSGTGIWILNIHFTDDRQLKDAQLQVPDLNINQTIPQTGRNGEVRQELEFTSTGAFPVTLILCDQSGNEAVIRTTVVVMMSEDEDPYQDYSQMYIINAAEDKDNYINGYYRYMDRTGQYQYTARFYASENNTPIYFVSAKTTDNDLFGVSPQVSSKLLNKNGYVLPVNIPQKGYYTIWIDLDAHTFSISEYTVPADTYTGPLLTSGTGFTIGDWALSGEMTQEDNLYRKQTDLELVAGYPDNYIYYFTSPDWSRIFRSDVDGNWWFEAAEGATIIYKTDYAGLVTITFDTAALWATIKKK